MEEAVCLLWEERDNDAQLHQPGSVTGAACDLRDVCSFKLNSRKIYFGISGGCNRRKGMRDFIDLSGVAVAGCDSAVSAEWNHKTLMPSEFIDAFPWHVIYESDLAYAGVTSCLHPSGKQRLSVFLFIYLFFVRNCSEKPFSRGRRWQMCRC